MENNKLSKNQIRILDFIRTFISENNVSPTVRDICAGTGLRSTSTIHVNLKALSEMGYVHYVPGIKRAISLADRSDTQSNKSLHIPLVGNVAAGTPILAVDNIQEFFTLPFGLVKGTSTGDVFMLRIKGDSMIEIDIHENDLIIVNSSESISNGDIAVARIDDSVTVKRFYLENNRVRLQPENSNMEPIYAKPDEVELVGKVVGLIRSF